jgi:Bacterial Ig-like domain (group 3)
VRGKNLGWVTGLGMALAMAVLPAAADAAQSVATETTLNVSTSDRAGRTQATATVNVTDEYGLPATGAVDIEDGSRILAEAALDGTGKATTTVNLLGGTHELRAVYSGDATHMVSTSPVSEEQAETGGTPDFAISLTPITPTSFPMVLTQGASGTVEVTITPQNNASLTGPMFVTLSCSSLPNLASCTFTPETIEILPSTPASCSAGSPAADCPPISSMLLQTEGPGTVAHASPQRKSSPVAWAFLLPGIAGFGGLAWGARRRAWLSRLALVALLGIVATLGVSGCSPLYRYYQHGPGNNPATPTGTFNVTITAQSSNGVTAITNNTTMVLTVQAAQ